MGIFDKVKNFIDNSDEDTIDEDIENVTMIRQTTLIRPTAQSPLSRSAISALLRDRRRFLRPPI